MKRPQVLIQRTGPVALDQKNAKNFRELSLSRGGDGFNLIRVYDRGKMTDVWLFTVDGAIDRIFIRGCKFKQAMRLRATFDRHGQARGRIDTGTLVQEVLVPELLRMRFDVEVDAPAPAPFSAAVH